MRSLLRQRESYPHQKTASWHTDPEYFTAVHEMGHVLDFAGNNRASTTVGG